VIFLNSSRFAFPGKHTGSLYNDSSRDEAGVLGQLKAGIGGLNGYLYKQQIVGIAAMRVWAIA